MEANNQEITWRRKNESKDGSYMIWKFSANKLWQPGVPTFPVGMSAEGESPMDDYYQL